MDYGKFRNMVNNYPKDLKINSSYNNFFKFRSYSFYAFSLISVFVLYTKYQRSAWSYYQINRYKTEFKAEEDYLQNKTLLFKRKAQNPMNII